MGGRQPAWSRADQGSWDPCDGRTTILPLVLIHLLGLPCPVHFFAVQRLDLTSVSFSDDAGMAQKAWLTVLLAWCDGRFSSAFFQVPLTDNLLSLPHYSRMCKLSHWYFPPSPGTFLLRTSDNSLTSHSVVLQRCYYLLNHVIYKSSAICVCKSAPFRVPIYDRLKKKSHLSVVTTFCLSNA